MPVATPGFGARAEPWPRVERLDLELRLHEPPAFVARATLSLSGVATDKVSFLLNRGLSLSAAANDGGTSVSWEEGGRVPSTHHREGRIVRVALGRAPEGGRVRLSLEWTGRAADGTGKSDWRGILLLAPAGFRMSEQTIFYPQVPTDLDGPGVEPVRGSVRVLAPPDFEVFVPGVPSETHPAAEDGARAWAFEVDPPSTLSLVAGRYRRHEIRDGGLLLVSLLKEERAALGPPLLEEVKRACAFYASRWGNLGAATLGVCEIECFANSYNWAAPGLLAFDGAALRDGVPSDKIGHEAAHLWWGGAARASGLGERFLTEGLAEYASWRWIEEKQGAAAAARHAAAERRDYLAAVHDAGEDAAVAKVTFGTKAYNAIAYTKSALVLRGVEAALGRDGMDAALAAYLRRGADGASALDAFVECALGPSGAARGALRPLFRDGHAHVALEGVRHDASTRSVSGSLVPAACPKGIASNAPGFLPLRVQSDGGSVDAAIPIGGGGAFGLPVTGEPIALFVDPNATTAIADVPAHAFRPARLVGSHPPDGARDAPWLVDRIVLEFDRPLAAPGPHALRDVRSALVNRASEAGAAFPSLGAVTLEREGLVLVLDLREPLPPAREVLVDLSGVLLDELELPVADASVRFRTAEADDRDRPRVVETEPASGATDVDPALARIRIVFSERMRPGRGYSGTEVAANEKKGWSFPLAGKNDSRWEEGGTVLVYELAAPLRPGATYLLPIGDRFRDVAANPLVDYELRFTTRK